MMIIVSRSRYFLALAAVAISLRAGCAVAHEDVLYSGDQLYADPHKGRTALVKGKYKFGLDHYGRLYLSGNCGTDILGSGGSATSVVKMQHDGNLVIYNLDKGHQHPVATWDSQTNKAGAKLVLYDGYVAIVKDDYVVWKYVLKCGGHGGHGGDGGHGGGDGGHGGGHGDGGHGGGGGGGGHGGGGGDGGHGKCVERCVGSSLKTHHKLMKGDYLCYEGQKFGLTCDGKWIYDQNGHVKVYGYVPDHHYGDINMQGDGNLVLYEVVGHKITALCSTQTVGHSYPVLYLTKNGPKIVVHGDEVVWYNQHISCLH